MTRENFNDLVRQHNRNLYVYAFRILRNQEEAEDAVQEVFIKLWNLGKKLDEYNSIGALAVTMLKNYCIDQIRKKKHFIQEQLEGMNLANTENTSPSELMETRESADILHQIIHRLPDIYKDAIVMREIDGQSYEEIVEKTKQKYKYPKGNFIQGKKNDQGRI
jgi:RNA polymerase sigma factor (sigma-70 family)